MTAAAARQDKIAFARFLSDDLVVNMRIRGRENNELWRTAVFVKEAGQWRQAAEITTPITGAARSAR